jgi:hypothetical protein
VEFFSGRVSPVGWAAFPAGKVLTEQGLKRLDRVGPFEYRLLFSTNKEGQVSSNKPNPPQLE